MRKETQRLSCALLDSFKGQKYSLERVRFGLRRCLKCKIPTIPPTRLATCRVIDVQYHLKLELALPNISINLKDEVPITIGTIPLRDTFANLAGSTLTLSPTAPINEADDEAERPTYLQVYPSNDGQYGKGDVDGKPFSRGRMRGMSVSSENENPSFHEYPDFRKHLNYSCSTRNHN
ncbi:unnamed protein product [Orchesella dallaii]|uniref:Arrestin C-terminal-like domain-containing protein n=1 Tax=Orchesella dallaii TaxID=48710 RepID=A0ABP1R9C1_9HEXA